jgi:NAD(P)-dependent dehydrogenase (short-subunit alcohol dehydrogenase family)
MAPVSSPVILIHFPKTSGCSPRRELCSRCAMCAAKTISPEEVAQAVLYLVSDASLMVTGTAIAIDGGKSLGVPPK